MLQNILLSFIPLFVAVDAIGILPIFVSLTEGMEEKARTKVILQSMCTAIGLAIGFVLVGKELQNNKLPILMSGGHWLGRIS